VYGIFNDLKQLVLLLWISSGSPIQKCGSGLYEEDNNTASFHLQCSNLAGVLTDYNLIHSMTHLTQVVFYGREPRMGDLYEKNGCFATSVIVELSEAYIFFSFAKSMFQYFCLPAVTCSLPSILSVVG